MQNGEREGQCLNKYCLVVYSLYVPSLLTPRMR